MTEATPAAVETATPAATPAPASVDPMAISAEIKTQYPSLAKYTSWSDAAVGFDNAQRMIGRPTDQLVEMPKADDEAGQRKLYEKLGLPAELSGYKLQIPEGTPAEYGAEAPLTKLFIETAHKSGVLPRQVQAIHQAVASAAIEQQRTADAETAAYFTDAETGLKAEWGAAYDQKIAAATSAVEKLGGDELREFLEGTSLAAEPIILKALAKVGELLKESGVGDRPSGDPSAANKFGFALAPEEARLRGSELLRKAMTEPLPMERRRLNAEAQKYFAMAAGNATV